MIFNLKFGTAVCSAFYQRRKLGLLWQVSMVDENLPTYAVLWNYYWLGPSSSVIVTTDIRIKLA